MLSAGLQEGRIGWRKEMQMDNERIRVLRYRIEEATRELASEIENRGARHHEHEVYDTTARVKYMSIENSTYRVGDIILITSIDGNNKFFARIEEEVMFNRDMKTIYRYYINEKYD